ncbi:MAG: heat-shock protein [Symploca sp. SIO2C1]|nr:heat-shock protein [Symploca sp. SIO2C1]
MNFKTVEEVTCWRNFTLDGKEYDLSHLNAHRVEYLDERDKTRPTTYRFIVTYGLHCFTKNVGEISKEQERLLMYHAPRESRSFNLERYELSKHLPTIIKSLGNKETLVCHAGYGKYAVVKVLNSRGCEVNYFVPFAVFRESKRLRLHVRSAYPRHEGLGKVKKVGFFVIAKNLLQNKNLPRPQK